MADTTFIDQQTRIQADWLNDVNDLTYNIGGTGSGQGASQVGQFGGGTVQDTIDAVGTVALGTADADISTAIAAARSAGGGVVSLVEAGAYAPASTPELVGEFTNGVVLDGRRAVITSGSTTQDGIKIGNEVGSIASSYFNKYKVENLVLTGAGTGGTAAGLYHVAAADIQFDNIRARNWAIGAYIHGGLTSDYSGLCVRDNGVGIKAEFYNDGAGGLNDFAPNANTFYGLRNFYNGVAVQYLYNPSGCVNWIGSNFEANNSTSGTTTDGKKVFEVTSGGHHNLFGCHFESNLGEFGVHYTGFDSTKSLCIIGSELIDAVGTNLHMAVGRLTAVASRITNVSSPNDIVFAVGTRGTLIDTEGAISGSLGNVLCIRDGRIQFGGQPITTDPPIKVLSAPIVASSNVAAIFRNDTVQIQFQNTAGTRSGYLQTSSTAEHTLNNDNAAGGWVFRANNSARMYIGRAGANSIEPAAANTIACGTATFPWSGGSTQVAFTVTSDERTKEQIEDIPQAWLNAWGEVKWQRYKLKDSVQQKGDGARWHVGLIAQRVKEAFERHGVDAFAIGLLCWDEWPAVYDTDGALVQPAGEKYAIRYEEALSLECAYLRSKLADGGA